VKPGRIASKLMAKHTSLLTKNTAFEHKFHVEMTKATKWWPYYSRSKKPDFIWPKTTGFRRKY
jgi:hypothetical protein